MANSLRLYSYFRSSCSYRVRIALGLKGLEYEYVPVHLLQDGGQQFSDSYLQRNPVAEVPTLEVLNEAGDVVATVSQSVAIMEYLEECYPEPALLPSEPADRAKVRQLVEVVNSSIQPIQNLKVMKKLMAQFDVERPVAVEWAAYWIELGFKGLEKLLVQTAGTYSFGDQLTLADAALVPQEYNARRFKIDMEQFPTIARVCEAAKALPAFQNAAPESQPDTPEDLK
ncbi:MAG: maleylacetoacetate isomerase [Deltaproteobacteria bacterium]|nr:MAG: maleylacetoacetate isomerase [Deltaproteobacteria bacterium]